MEIVYRCCPFHSLTLEELYDLLRLRSEVFVVEQACVFLDLDGRDADSWHLLGSDVAGSVVAYTRLMPEGLPYEGYVSIGRVVTAPTIRRTGAGRALMWESLRLVTQLWPGLPVKIGAQCYLTAFYEGFEFRCVGAEYMEDGIPHIHMVRPAAN